MSIYSTLDSLHQEGEKDGRQCGLSEGAARQFAKLLLRHGKRAFGPAGEEQRTLLESLADRADRAGLEQIGARFLAAKDWLDLLEGARLSGVLQAAPPPPEYLLPFDFDPTPMPPSIDQCCSVTMQGGMKMTVLLRLQRLYQPNLGEVLYKESQQLEKRTGGLVQIAVLLLWPGADGPAVSGEYRPGNDKIFRYGVSRLWEKDVDEMLTSPALATFAPLARFSPERFAEVMRRVDEIISAQKDPETVSNLWSVTYISMGLRYRAEEVNQALAHVMPILRRLPEMRASLSRGYYEGHSSGLRDGAIEATRRWVLLLGTQKLGEPPLTFRSTFDGIQGLERLEQIAARLFKADTWPEVLALQ